MSAPLKNAKHEDSPAEKELRAVALALGMSPPPVMPQGLISEIPDRVRYMMRQLAYVQKQAEAQGVIL